MKRLPAIMFALVLLSLVSGQVVSTVQAQMSTPDPMVSPIITPAPINLTGGISDAEFNKQMSGLQVTYRNQLTTYRADEKTFQVAKDQYYQIQTLASLEEAVRSTRQAMISRLDVIQTYFLMAKLTLENTKGIETDVKSDTLKQLDTLTTDLKIHRAAVAASSDRTGLLAVATEFATLSPRISDLSQKISMLVTYGRLQTVDDKATTIKQELKNMIDQTETDPLKLAEKKRGLDEIQRNLDQVNTLLVNIRTTLNPKLNSNSANSRSISDDFSNIFGGLSRSISYLQELVKN